MPNWRAVSTRIVAAFVLAAAPASAAFAANPTADTLSTQLAPLIESAHKPERFAVPVPVSVTTQSRGAWTRSGSTLVWRYSLSVTEAVSLSFHAAHIKLSPHARLIVSGGGKNYIYSAKDVHRGQLWSRIARGNRLDFQLQVPANESGSVFLAIDSAQAGFRSLDGRGPNHPYYDRLLKQAAALQADTAGCVENYACHVTTANQGPGQATVALTINNEYLCSGVLLNDVPMDGMPYVLTARHCENGDSDGGHPEAAAGIVVYWDVLSPCNAQVLGTVFDPSVLSQGGATTIVEQQDAWLVKLDQYPIATDAYFAGWDASGNSFTGGYSIHHGDGASKQFVAWFGKADFERISANALGVHYDSTLWGTVNQLGSINPGASGGGLFNASNRLVGVLVRAKAENDRGVCPVGSPPTPSLSADTGFSTALSGIYSSTADPVSTTGAVTIQSVLDPNNTAVLTMDGAGPPPYVTLLSDTSGPANTGLAMDLKWFAPSDSSCVASGGAAGDGWGGPIPSTGSQWVTNYTGGPVTYIVSCTRDERVGSASLQLDWQLSPPHVTLDSSGPPFGVGVPFTLYWNGNLGPCIGSGGAAGNGWNGVSLPINGSAQVTEPASGTYTYTITCGSGSRTASSRVVVSIDAPHVNLYGDATTVLVGQTVLVQWESSAQPCQTTGGASGDGWAGHVVSAYGSLMLTESAPGTYVYHLTCGPASEHASAQLSLTFTSGSPSVTLSASPSQNLTVGLFSTTTLSWNSNVRPCSLSVAGPEPGAIYSDGRPQSSAAEGRDLIGDYVYTITCGVLPASATATLNLTWGGTPAVSITNSSPYMVKGIGEGIEYLTNIAPCVATGGAPGDGWAGTYTDRDRLIGVVPAQSGTFTYALTCGSGSQTAQTQVTITVLDSAPTATLTVDNPSPLYGQPVVLTWTSNQSTCNATGGVAGDGWASGVAGNGSATITENMAGDVRFNIECGASPLTTYASVDVSYRAFPAPDLQASTTSAFAGDPVTLTWQSSNGSACVGAQGRPGDGWAGNHPASGSMVVTSDVGGVDYQMYCGVSNYADVVVIYQPSNDTPPLPVGVQLSGAPLTLDAGKAVTLTWAAQNALACSAGGGSGSDTWQGDLSPGGGSTQVIEQTAGTYMFMVSCTAGTLSASAQQTVTFSAVSSGGGGGGGGGGGSGGGGSLHALDFLLLALYGLVISRKVNIKP